VLILKSVYVKEVSDHSSSAALSPRASKESEQWRYERMVKLIESIKKPLASSDPIKQGYEATLKEVTQELFRELEKVAPIRDIEEQDIGEHRINELVRNAAELWLDIGQQRFRTRLVMSGTGEKAVKSRQNALSPSGTLNLVVSPGLRRLGNAQGEQLNHEESVMSCEGTFEVFRTR
jgi:hypothetical protein